MKTKQLIEKIIFLCYNFIDENWWGKNKKSRL